MVSVICIGNSINFFLMLISLLMKEEIGYKTFGGIAIDGIIIMAGIVGMKISVASMKPACSFGPTLIDGNLSFNWIYWIAPMIGSVIAVFVFKLINSTEADRQQRVDVVIEY
jgi:glycerol uptake facilitator-like aquaporin